MHLAAETSLPSSGYWLLATDMLTVNDVPLAYEPGMTVRDVLKRKNYIWRMIAVFIDGELVPKAKYDTRQVPDGADVKVIHQIAGG